LGRGDAEEAITQFSRGPGGWTPDLVEAHVRAGRTDDAKRVAASRPDEDASASPTVRAGAAWARALVADDGASGEAFAEAAGALETLLGGRSFELARLRLNWGERLRRSGRRREAREHLRAAHERFELLGAEPWAERARAELRASGETARRRNPSSLDDLTPQELQVAREIASGATYRKAAENLFLSPKTIEFHLRKVYRKLDVASRQELAGRLETLERDRASGEEG
jgi:DNA-binding CsgD family transcriptional regulator